VCFFFFFYFLVVFFFFYFFFFFLFFFFAGNASPAGYIDAFCFFFLRHVPSCQPAVPQNPPGVFLSRAWGQTALDGMRGVLFFCAIFPSTPGAPACLFCRTAPLSRGSSTPISGEWFAPLLLTRTLGLGRKPEKFPQSSLPFFLHSDVPRPSLTFPPDQQIRTP